MSEIIDTLNQLLEIEPRPAKDGNKPAVWPEMSEVLDNLDEPVPGKGLAQLFNFIKRSIEEQPVQVNRNKKKLETFYSTAGKVLTKHILSDVTMLAYMTKLRKAAYNHHGKDAIMPIIESPKGRFSDKQRTIKTNIRSDQNVEESHKQGAYLISLERIKALQRQFIKDIDSNNQKYNHAVPLLFQLTCGGRISEIINAAVFTAVDTDPEVKYPQETRLIKQQGILKKRKDDNIKQGRERGRGKNIEDSDDEYESDDEEGIIGGANGDDEDLIGDAEAVLIKPILPLEGLTVDYLIEKLNAWRVKYRQEAQPGVYNRLASMRVIHNINKLLQDRYGVFLPDKTVVRNKIVTQKKITTHLLRSIYAAGVIAYYLPRHETAASFLKRHLGHDNINTGKRYNWVKIVPDEPSDNIELDMNGNAEQVQQQEIEAPEAPEQQEQEVERIDMNQYVTKKEFNKLLKQNEEILKLLQQLVLQQQPQPILPIERADNLEQEEPKPILRRSARNSNLRN